MTLEYTQRTAHLFKQCRDYYHRHTIKKNMKLSTRADTIAAMVERGTTQKENRNAQKYDPEAIRRDYYDNKMTYKAIMIKHGIRSKGTVSHIINKALGAKGRR